ncbi:hypothetical protein [Actinoplanes sp. NPDC049316]|uniref:hypothetical protein n=1 Tax=Actinoplanes sp. NPDC049316 TaxID=3154727 RepID=UPI00342A240F
MPDKSSPIAPSSPGSGDDRVFVVAAGDTLYAFDRRPAAAMQYVICVGANLDVDAWQLTPARWDEVRRELAEQLPEVEIVDTRAAARKPPPTADS